MTPILHYDLAEIEQSVAARFETQVRRTPHRLALQDATESLTYEELNRRANRAAHAILAQSASLESEPVAFLIEQNVSAVVTILAILKAGKFYVPLDASLPGARLQAILEDCGASLIVTNAANLERAQNLSSSVRVLNLDALPTTGETNPAIQVLPDALLNLMYTSGTTGEPKGVMQTQRNVLHLVVSTDFPPLQSDDRVGQMISFSFGGSAAMLFRALFNGAALFLFDLKKAGIPQLAHFLVEHSITRFHTVPTVLRSWLDLLPGGQIFPKLRLVEIGGEPLFKRDLERLFRHLPGDSYVRNTFGTTETYVALWDFLTAKDELGEQVIPVGRPAPGMEALILDENGKCVADGETGEIWIKSRYLSPGYWNKPELTRRTFLAEAEQPGVVLYKTGDLGRVRADGAIEHLGRQDGMVKIRGHQVVLTLVESAVRALPEVKDAAVIAQPNAAGDQHLVAYVVSAHPSANVLRAMLEPVLAAYMIPSTFVFLDQLPRLPNGKLDRRTLPALQEIRPALETSYVAPRTPLEVGLAQIWCDVLRIEHIGVHDAFVELGGDSLQAAQVVARASLATGIEIPLSAVFDTPTIQALAQLMTRRMAEQVSADDLERMLREAESLNAN